jgi:hypothetical protein
VKLATSPIAPSQRVLADIAADLSSAHTGPASAAASRRSRAVPEAPSEGTDSSSPIPSREEPVSRAGRPAPGRDHSHTVSVTMPLSQMKTLAGPEIRGRYQAAWESEFSEGPQRLLASS